MKKPIVLFLCTTNAARSQMAEALLREMAGDCYDARSAGLAPTAVTHVAVQAMAEIGIDIADQRAKGVAELSLQARFAYVVTLCERTRVNCCELWDTPMNLHWPIDDPDEAEGGEAAQLAVARRARDELADHIAELVRQTCADFGAVDRRFCRMQLLP